MFPGFLLALVEASWPACHSISFCPAESTAGIIGPACLWVIGWHWWLLTVYLNFAMSHKVLVLGSPIFTSPGYLSSYLSSPFCLSTKAHGNFWNACKLGTGFRRPALPSQAIYPDSFLYCPEHQPALALALGPALCRAFLWLHPFQPARSPWGQEGVLFV